MELSAEIYSRFIPGSWKNDGFEVYRSKVQTSHPENVYNRLDYHNFVYKVILLYNLHQKQILIFCRILWSGLAELLKNPLYLLLEARSRVP
jgi:hypothetical protein